jgi:hypothetical protein
MINTKNENEYLLKLIQESLSNLNYNSNFDLYDIKQILDIHTSIEALSKKLKGGENNG